ncbi:MAG: VWA domain-containing protein [Ignavibacteria bacterium]|nr:VWA domain-containing protein [Ignavibacteria bacterium]
MKHRAALLTILFGALIFQPHLKAKSSRPTEAFITFEGSINYPYISHRGGTAYLQIAISTSDFRPVHRRPMNVSVVLDRSGSMADQGKIDYAKSALHNLIDQLRSEDILSIVIYDDAIEVLRPAKRVGNRKKLKRLVDSVYPRGATNLGGGMIEGFQQVERNLDKEYVNRVILLSDGLANRGIINLHRLNRIASKNRSKSISLTTMGVGLNYNENLMVGLAESGGGNYYFIESPNSLASIMSEEFNTLSSVLAQNASIELTLGQGVQVMDIIGCEFTTRNNRYVIQVGDLYSNERRELTVEVQIAPGKGSLLVARGTLNFDGGDADVGHVRPFKVSVNYTKNTAVIEKNRDLDAQAKADVAVSTRMVEQAMKALDEGREEDAAKQLSDARSVIIASPAAASVGAAGKAIREQEAKLEEYSDTLRQNRDDVNKAKKSIQYDNYKTRKNK